MFSTLTFVLTRGATFASLLVLARLLAPSQFGLVAAVAVVLSFIELTADLGMKATVIYEQENSLRSLRLHNAFTLTLLATTLLSALAVLLAPAVASFFHAPHHVGLFRLAGLDILVTGLGSIQDGLLLRDLRFRARIFTEVIGAVLRSALGVGLAIAGFGAASMVWGFIAGSAATTLALWFVSGYRPRLNLRPAIVKSMIGYGTGASLLSIISQLASQIDVTVIGRVLGQRALGLYTVAYRVPTLLLENIAYQVSLVVFPALAQQRARSPSDLAASTIRLVRYQSLYALPLGAGMAVLARPIVLSVFSAKWLPATGVFAAISVMSGVHASSFALGDAFKALGRQRVMVVLNLIQFPLLVATIILVAPYGVTAVAWARCAEIVFWVGLMTASAARVLRVSVASTLAAMRPGAIAALGVVLGTGMIRLTGLPAGLQLLLAVPIALGGGTLALAVFARSTFREARSDLMPRRAHPGPRYTPHDDELPLSGELR